MHNFVKNLELVSNAFFMKVLKKLKRLAGKSHSVFEGLKGGPFKHTKTFSEIFFFQQSYKMHFTPIQKKITKIWI